MNNTKLLNCQCGEQVEVNYGTCMEYHGATWQDVQVACLGKCGYSVDITFNADIKGQNAVATELVVEAWNKQQKAIESLS